MRLFICGLVIGLLLSCGTSYAYRFGKPQRITSFDQNGLVILNTALEQIWDVINGKYVPNVVSSVPSKSSEEEGILKIYSSGGVYKIYIYLNGGWRSWTSD